MVRGLYTAYTGMVNSQHRLDVVSNNLANATTTGYKKEGCTTQSFDAVYGIKIKDATVGHVNQNIGKLSLGAKIGETYRNWEQGSFVTTDNTYDFALSGKGFFTISFTNKAGETSTMYTRDGSFQMNADGYLVTKDGDYVLGESGEPIVLPTDATNIAVEPTGEIYINPYICTNTTLLQFQSISLCTTYYCLQSLRLYAKHIFKKLFVSCLCYHLFFITISCCGASSCLNPTRLSIYFFSVSSYVIA